MDKETAQFLQTRSEDDIARTKQRQSDVTNYSILISVGLVGAAKLFADDQIATLTLFRQLQFLIVLNAFLSIFLQVLLLFSLHRFRARVREARKVLALKYDSPFRKLWGDLVFMTYFFGASPVAAFVALQYTTMHWCAGVEECSTCWLLLN